MHELRVLDLYCRKGGASMGYVRAGFDVTGVDIEDHSAGYPGGMFIEGDAIEFARKHGHKFDLIHAGPPCQDDCALTNGTNAASRKGMHVNLLAPTRDALEEVGVPYVIEQPIGKAVMRRDLLLCGLMFDLKVFRHRQFELGGWAATSEPKHPSHAGHRVAGWRHGVRRDGDMVAVYGNGGGKGSVADWQQAMGIDWMHDKKDLTEAIPPAYTEFIGRLRAVQIRASQLADRASA